MIGRAVRGRSQCAWLAFREGMPSEGANYCNLLVGKQSGIRWSSTSTSTSFRGDCLARVEACDRANYLISLASQSVCLAPPGCGPACIKSILLVLRKRTACTSLGPPTPNLLSLHELLSVARYMPLTSALPTRYVGVQPGGSRYGDSAAKESGSVPGTLDNQGKEARS